MFAYSAPAAHHPCAHILPPLAAPHRVWPPHKAERVERRAPLVGERLRAAARAAPPHAPHPRGELRLVARAAGHVAAAVAARKSREPREHRRVGRSSAVRLINVAVAAAVVVAAAGAARQRRQEALAVLFNGSQPAGMATLPPCHRQRKGGRCSRVCEQRRCRGVCTALLQRSTARRRCRCRRRRRRGASAGCSGAYAAC